ncbi:RnfABCDGE type electron transport complex subunit G [Isachenkonia alkalipeptolytica]|uniref:Ion-translocating oxidoreductase complex subunit G n=1 Tax=Isachenkonia alkalipeptolytica TaxID=2565777 RepID=A0AA43XLD3_9CLOT|nr:RnfABCDGE type electron transport complex subunit G [Isachenkonia alkalipeptolytica]NBG88960.1 RnfABCDGE type electron transport complex subunit G [Isachenkonia alkalipeptolytica]
MREIIKLGLILLVITSVAGLILGGVNSMTADIIEERAIEESMEAIEAFFPGLEEAGIIEDGDILAYDLVEEVYEVSEGGNVIGYTIKTVANGYDGPIEVLTGINMDGEITGIEIISQTETPGLGDRITEEDFKDQFEGQSSDSEVEVDVLSGATVSSDAVVNGVNAAANVFEEELRD